MTGWIYTENGFWELEAEGKRILKAYARAESADGRCVDTRTARLEQHAGEGGMQTLRFAGDEGLILTERLCVTREGIGLGGLYASGSRRKGSCLQTSHSAHFLRAGYKGGKSGGCHLEGSVGPHALCPLRQHHVASL